VSLKLAILGVGGTFMAGVAALARELGHTVVGVDRAVYPPMSTQLERLGIDLREGYLAEHLERDVDLVIVGNALSRGLPLVEALLDSGLPYSSGPAWVADAVLRGRRGIAIAGTHGKTTTSSLVAWMLETAGEAPGFLIGGLPGNFPVSARLGAGPCFVIEADEYDSAFFDKRSKFVHYRPEVALLNNLEFDHADIFPDLAAIETQFHHLIRTVPSRGRILAAAGDGALDRVLARGVWTKVERFGLATDAAWSGAEIEVPARCWQLRNDGREFQVQSPLRGRHNLHNAVGAAAAVHAVGVAPARAWSALAEFRLPKRRLERVGAAAGVVVYDDFAHHPTAIAATLAALRGAHPGATLIAALEVRSNSMRRGAHAAALAPALASADRIHVLSASDGDFDPGPALASLGRRATVHGDAEALLAAIAAEAAPGQVVVAMSNGHFGAVPRRLLEVLSAAGSMLPA
jgi:UDP-N-acetylmuramate: L-alanyl-gamma-D-glutamyl-meso-diaminopimelate ligase